MTVSIGGNDVTGCASALNAIVCVAGVTTEITTNVTLVADALRTALNANGDTSAQLIGLTYPDVILGGYVYPSTTPPIPWRGSPSKRSRT